MKVTIASLFNGEPITAVTKKPEHSPSLVVLPVSAKKKPPLLPVSFAITNP